MPVLLVFHFPFSEYFCSGPRDCFLVQKSKCSTLLGFFSGHCFFKSNKGRWLTDVSLCRLYHASLTIWLMGMHKFLFMYQNTYKMRKGDFGYGLEIRN